MYTHDLTQFTRHLNGNTEWPKTTLQEIGLLNPERFAALCAFAKRQKDAHKPIGFNHAILITRLVGLLIAREYRHNGARKALEETDLIFASQLRGHPLSKETARFKTHIEQLGKYLDQEAPVAQPTEGWNNFVVRSTLKRRGLYQTTRKS